jgi:hypothetical protein
MLSLLFWWYWGLNSEPSSLGRQAFHHLSHTLSPFWISYFWDRISWFFCPVRCGPWYPYLCIPQCTIAPSNCKWSLLHIFPGLALSHSPPDLHLPSRQDYRQAWATTSSLVFGFLIQRHTLQSRLAWNSLRIKGWPWTLPSTCLAPPHLVAFPS